MYFGIIAEDRKALLLCFVLLLRGPLSVRLKRQHRRGSAPVFITASIGASELDAISENPLGVSPRALSRASSVSLGARKHRREALSSKCSPHQKSRRSCFARAPSESKLGDSFLRELRLALVPRVGSSNSWLRQPCFEAHRKFTRKLLMRHPIVDLGLTSHV